MIVAFSVNIASVESKAGKKEGPALLPSDFAGRIADTFLDTIWNGSLAESTSDGQLIWRRPRFQTSCSRVYYRQLMNSLIHD